MSDCSGQTSQFEPITGRWKAEPDFNLDPPVRMPGGSVHQWLGALLLIRSHAMDRVPSSISACRAREACRASTSSPVPKVVQAEKPPTAADR